MRKLKFSALILTVIMGIAGFVLRRYELLHVFEEDTGLPTRGAPVTTALIILSCAALAAGIIIAILAGKCEPGSYGEAMYKGTWDFVLAAASGIAVVLGAVVGVISAAGAGRMGIAELVQIILALAAGISMAVCAWKGVRRGDTNGLRLAAIVPAVFLCYWMILAYKDHSSDAVLLDYVYMLLAMAAGALYYYYSAGFAFNKPMFRRTVCCAVVTVFFAAAAAADMESAANRIIFAAIAVNALTGLFSLLSYKQRT